PVGRAVPTDRPRRCQTARDVAIGGPNHGEGRQGWWEEEGRGARREARARCRGCTRQGGEAPPEARASRAGGWRGRVAALGRPRVSARSPARQEGEQGR